MARAQREASLRGLSIHCSVADMRRVHEHHQRTFEVVLACDNSIPHLLSDTDTTFYVIEHHRGAKPIIHASQTTYYAVCIATFARLMEQAGFLDVRRIDGQFFQPVLVGRKRDEHVQIAEGGQHLED